MLQGIYRLESEPKSDDIDCYEALHDCDTDSLVIEDYLFADNDGVPNNPSLPLIVYRGALKTAGDAATSRIALFDRNGWTGAWTNGVYSHHHYHSSAHEVLGIAAGWVRV